MSGWWRFADHGHLEVAMIYPEREECQEAFTEGFCLMHELRRSGRSCRHFPGKFPAGQLKKAARRGAVWAVIIGGDEVASGEATMKPMGSKILRKCPIGEVVDYFADEF